MWPLVSFVAGFVSGWATRSISDTPHGVGVELLEVAIKTKTHVEKWAAAEYERLADMTAEAQSRVSQTSSRAGKPRKASKAAAK
jgi:hypothetical protein